MPASDWREPFCSDGWRPLLRSLARWRTRGDADLARECATSRHRFFEPASLWNPAETEVVQFLKGLSATAVSSTRRSSEWFLARDTSWPGCAVTEPFRRCARETCADAQVTTSDCLRTGACCRCG